MNWYKKSQNEYFYIGNCINGLEDTMFQDIVSNDATEMQQFLDLSLPVEKFTFFNSCKIPFKININSVKFYYNKEKDIFILYDFNKDVHYFFAKI
jgi:hypothetical protein